MPSKLAPRIVEAAAKLFSEKGFAATTMKEIARAAKVAELTIFRLHNTKEALFAAALDWSTANWRTPLPDVEQALSHPDIAVAFRRVTTTYFQQTDPRHLRLWLYAILEVPQILTPERMIQALEIQQAVESRIVKGIAEDAIDASIHPVIAASQIGTSHYGLTILSGITKHTLSPEQMQASALAFVDIWLNGVLHRDESRRPKSRLCYNSLAVQFRAPLQE